jgi:hypothetical protein
MNSDKASQDIHSYTRGVKWKPKSAQKIKTLLCAALGTTSGQHGLDACTVYGRSGNVMIKDEVALNQNALNYLVTIFLGISLMHLDSTAVQEYYKITDTELRLMCDCTLTTATCCTCLTHTFMN